MANQERKPGSKRLDRLQAFRIFRIFGFVFCLLSGFASLRTEAAAPDWASETEASYLVYQFTNNALEPLPTDLNNGYGDPTALVFVEEFGAGWQDPEVVYALSGVNSDGAWDLGPGGAIEVTVPFAPSLTAPGSSYEVEFYVYLVGYDGLVSLPLLSVVDYPVQEETSDVALVQDDVLGSYKSLTWTGRVMNLSSNLMSFAATASPDGALVDSLVVYTLYTLIPGAGTSYTDWVSENFPDVDDPSITSFDAAPDGDGVANGLKYYLGRSRSEASPTLNLDSQSETGLTFSHTRAASLPTTISEQYQWSIDLSAWYAAGATHEGVTVDFNITSTDSTPLGHDVLTVEASFGGVGSDTLFVRLLVEESTG